MTLVEEVLKDVFLKWGPRTSQCLIGLQGLLTMLYKRPAIVADLREPRGERQRGRAVPPDLASLLEWLWAQAAMPERRARVWVQTLHARLAHLDRAAAHVAAQARVLPLHTEQATVWWY